MQYQSSALKESNVTECCLTKASVCTHTNFGLQRTAYVRNQCVDDIWTGMTLVCQCYETRDTYVVFLQKHNPILCHQAVLADYLGMHQGNHDTHQMKQNLWYRCSPLICCRYTVVYICTAYVLQWKVLLSTQLTSVDHKVLNLFLSTAELFFRFNTSALTSASSC